MNLFSLLSYGEVNSIQIIFHTFSLIHFNTVQIMHALFVLQITPAMKVYRNETMTSSIMEAMCSPISQMPAQVLPNFRLLTLIN